MQPLRVLALAAPLLIAAALAGCADAPTAEAEGESSIAPPAADAMASAVAACVQSSERVLEWAAGEPSAEAQSGDGAFDVPRGARALDIAWTAPEIVIGSYSVEIRDPDGELFFQRSVSAGVQMAGFTFQIGDVGEKSNERTPPLPGAYAFAWSYHGAADGASVVATVTGCF